MRNDTDLLPPEVFEFRADAGEVWIHDQRVRIVSAAAVGQAKHDMRALVGPDEVRRLARRFGYVHGYLDGVNLREGRPWADPSEGLRLAPALMALEGLAHAELTRLDLDTSTGHLTMEVTWRHSCDVEEYLFLAAEPPAQPVCCSLIGYLSGYATACFGREVCFQETTCAAVSGSHCAAVGRDAEQPEADREAWRCVGTADLMADADRLMEAVRHRREADARRATRGGQARRELETLRERVDDYVRGSQMVLASRAMRETLELAARVAPLETSVLVSGESGTGKEFVVRMIHEQSGRAREPFVSVNCAALTESLLESELFGHVRGAFTDAVRDKAGLFELASRGTLFLDEVGEMTPALQAKLLRAVQEHEIRRVGSEVVIRAHPRVIAATNRDLRAAVHTGTFREDLYYRLAAFTIEVPPLRERREAIPALAAEFVRRAAARFERPVEGIAPDAMTVLLDYPWPGNVRELQHALERAVILATGPRITTRELPPDLRLPDGGQPLPETATFDLHAREREVIERALARFNGNRRRTAEALGISTVTLWRRIRQYGVTLPGGHR